MPDNIKRTIRKCTTLEELRVAVDLCRTDDERGTLIVLNMDILPPAMRLGMRLQTNKILGGCFVGVDDLLAEEGMTMQQAREQLLAIGININDYLGE